jgi:hypothetical protein
LEDDAQYVEWMDEEVCDTPLVGRLDVPGI